MAGQDGLIDTDELRAFDAVATSRSFSRAAATLGCSQSAISQRIARLEKRIGRRIIRRTTRRVELTADGEAMLIYARSILALTEDARQVLARPALQGLLKVGIEDEFATTRLPLALSIFRQEFPNFGMKFVTGRNEHLHDALRAEEVDLILGKGHQDDRGDVLWHEHLAWVGHPGTQVAPGAPLKLITYTAPSITRAIVETALTAARRDWTIVVEGSNLLGLLAAAEAGLGVMAIGRSFRTPGIAALAADAGLPSLGTLSYVLEGHSGPAGAAGDAFCAVLRSAAQQVARPEVASPEVARPAPPPAATDT
ncbi:LysR family transcriptional regulator [Xanthobacter sp. V4C-4]|uniref:LysR family transcriptional regulator n=1 Tax=Xanthobacter cornucopiae TaxID=3119924 RepID=UPI00372A3068